MSRSPASPGIRTWRSATSCTARATSSRRRTTRTGLLLVAPALLFVGAFALWPLVFGVYISLTNWPLVGPYHYVGLANYTSLLHNSVFLGHSA
jgi:multiple sugar transport system permease protein